MTDAARSNARRRYDAATQLLHWAIGAAIIAMFGLGLYMHELDPGPEKFRLYDLHKSIGLTLFAAALLRLAWRSLVPAPPPLPETSREERRLAKLMHGALYVCMLILPLTGWAMASASGDVVDWFDAGIAAPALTAPDGGLRIAFRILHDLIGKIMMALVVLHIGMALKRHFIDRDGTLKRMLPFGRV